MALRSAGTNEYAGSTKSPRSASASDQGKVSPVAFTRKNGGLPGTLGVRRAFARSPNGEPPNTFGSMSCIMAPKPVVSTSTGSGSRAS